MGLFFRSCSDWDIRHKEASFGCLFASIWVWPVIRPETDVTFLWCPCPHWFPGLYSSGWIVSVVFTGPRPSSTAVDKSVQVDLWLDNLAHIPKLHRWGLEQGLGSALLANRCFWFDSIYCLLTPCWCTGTTWIQDSNLIPQCQRPELCTRTSMNCAKQAHCEHPDESSVQLSEVLSWTKMNKEQSCRDPVLLHILGVCTTAPRLH